MSQSKENPIFRQKSLDRLSSPDQIDVLIEIMPTKNWCWIGTLGFVVFSALVWSIFGRIPLSVSGQGILIYPSKVKFAQSLGSGRLVELDVTKETVVKKGQVIAKIDMPELQQQLIQEELELSRLQARFDGENLLSDEKDQQTKLLLKQQNFAFHKQMFNAGADGSGAQSVGKTKLIQDSLDALLVQKKSLEEQLVNANLTLQNIQAIYVKQLKLRQQELITLDILLQTQQQLYSQRDKISSIKYQIKALDSDYDKLQQNIMENTDKIQQLKGNLIDLKGQEKAMNLAHLSRLRDEAAQINALQNKIKQLKLQLNNYAVIKSPYDGTILAVEVSPGQLVQPGQNIAKILRSDINDQLECLTYVTIADGKKIFQGMKATVNPTNVDKNEFGGILGSVEYVAPFPVTADEEAISIGDPKLAQEMTANGQSISIKIKLNVDPKTFSGFQWSSGKGPKAKVSQGTTAISEIITTERAPITYVIPLLKTWSGMN